MITIGVSKWYQEYMDYDEDGDNMEDWKLSATQVLDKLLNINKGDVPTDCDCGDGNGVLKEHCDCDDEQAESFRKKNQ